MDRAGSRNTRVDVLQSHDVRVAGVPTEEWGVFASLWAEETTRPADQYARMGIEISQRAVSFRFAWEDGRRISRSMRLSSGGSSFDIRNIDADGDLKRHVIVMAVEIESDPTRAVDQWREEMRSGEIVLLRKVPFSGPTIECFVRAKVSGFEPQELNAGVDLAARKLIIYTADIEFEEPLAKGDQIVLDHGNPSENVLTIEAVDANTHRVAGQTPVLEVVAFGA